MKKPPVSEPVPKLFPRFETATFFNKTQKNGEEIRFFVPGIKRYGWQCLVY
jgi:hypothetical protein